MGIASARVSLVYVLCTYLQQHIVFLVCPIIPGLNFSVVRRARLGQSGSQTVEIENKPGRHAIIDSNVAALSESRSLRYGV